MAPPRIPRSSRIPSTSPGPRPVNPPGTTSPPRQPLVIEIDAVVPSPQGFALMGQGGDGAEYRLSLHFDVPLDTRTRSVLGELLSQSDVTIARA